MSFCIVLRCFYRVLLFSAFQDLSFLYGNSDHQVLCYKDGRLRKIKLVFPLHFLFEVPLLGPESKWSFICVLGISFFFCFYDLHWILELFRHCGISYFPFMATIIGIQWYVYLTHVSDVTKVTLYGAGRICPSALGLFMSCKQNDLCELQHNRTLLYTLYVRRCRCHDCLLVSVPDLDKERP